MAIFKKGVACIPYFSIQSYQQMEPQLFWMLITSNFPSITCKFLWLSYILCWKKQTLKVDEAAKHSRMCFYWKMILHFEVLLLIYLWSIREGNFEHCLALLYRMLFVSLLWIDSIIYIVELFIGLIWNCWSTIALTSTKNFQQETSHFWRPRNNSLASHLITSINRATNT